MDLFTYLMAKNGNNTSVHGDLFSYLLGKGQSQIYTISGTTIYIPNAKKLVSFMMTKESTQETTTGKNLLVYPYINTSKTSNGIIYTDNGDGTITANGTATANSTFTLNNQTTTGLRNLLLNNECILNGCPNGGSGSTYCVQLYGYTSTGSGQLRDIGSGVNLSEFVNENNNFNISIFISSGTTVNNLTFKPMIRLSSIIDDTYEPYTGGQPSPSPEYPQEVKTIKNNVNITISDGTTTCDYTISLGNNEIVGIGNYKDELLVDKNGHVFINKKTGKIVLNGSETGWGDESGGAPYSIPINNLYRDNSHSTLMSNYFIGLYWNAKWGNYSYFVTTNTNSATTPKIKFKNVDVSSLEDFKTWLSSNNTDVYYVLATPQLIDLNTTVDLKLFKGVNNVSNSEDGYMTIEYK